MANKVLVSDLVLAVSEITSLPKSRCEDYLKSFFEAIANALATDGIVKVKGLGTFKLISVDERKSVNVQTGAEMLIPAHSKVTFTPDKILKDEINKPYSHLKTYVLNNDAPLDPPEPDEDETEVDDTEVTAENISAISANVTTDNDTVNVTSSEVETENSVSEDKPISHSDWYDNWEVEYDNSSSSCQAQDIKTVENEEKGNQAETCPLNTNSTVDSKCSDFNLEQNVVDSENISVDPVTAQNLTEESTTENRVSDEDLEDKAEVFTSNQSENQDSSGSENVNDDKVTTAVEEGTDNSIIDQTSNISTATSITDENPKRKKGLGIAIIAFIFLLIVAIVAILSVNPDFFKSLKANDTPPTLPNDSISLSQELSVIKQADTSMVAKTDSMTAVASDNSVKKDSLKKIEDQKKKVEKKTEPVKETAIKPADPLWSSSFVSYMKRKHSDCCLSTAGLKGETIIKKGTYLTMVALENYGDKSYWIYLYLYNKDRIKNPNNVTAGTKVRVPVLDKSLVNGTDPTKVALANEVRQVFIK